MNTDTEIAELRRELCRLAGETEPAHVQRYALKFPPPENISPYRRMRRWLGRVLRRLGLRRAPPVEPWLPGIGHMPDSETASALVVWALDVRRDDLRRACEGFRTMEGGLRGWAPVLVTDVADFAFFSRLGWLVEYVPALSAPASDYADRKQRYLAWRYRHAPAVPVSIGLRDGLTLQDLELG